MRGLGSGHDAARQGFGLALSAALVKVPEIESLPALDMLDAALEVSKSTKVSSPPSNGCLSQSARLDHWQRHLPENILIFTWNAVGLRKKKELCGHFSLRRVNTTYCLRNTV